MFRKEKYAARVAIAIRWLPGGDTLIFYAFYQIDQAIFINQAGIDLKIPEIKHVFIP